MSEIEKSKGFGVKVVLHIAGCEPQEFDSIGLDPMSFDDIEPQEPGEPVNWGAPLKWEGKLTVRQWVETISRNAPYLPSLVSSPDSFA